MNIMHRIVGSTATLVLTATLFSALSAPPALACPEVVINSATGEITTSTEMRAALRALTEGPKVADATR